MELLPLGPVVLIDTAGLDDEGELGVQRVRRSMRELDRVDIVLLVLDGNAEVTPPERALLDACAARGVTCLLVRNKSDQYPQHADGDGAFWVSAKTGENISALRERIASLAQAEPPRPPIIADLARARRPCRTRYAHRRVRAERPADSAPAADYPRHTRRGRPGPRHERRRAGAGVFTPA